MNSISLLATITMTAKILIILVLLQSVYISVVGCGLQDSQDEGISFGDGNAMFKMCRQ
jgi:hypothetical protein